MWDGLSLWPWWLWTLSGLWIGALLFWQTTDTIPQERWGWGALALVYAGLILIGGRMVPAMAAAPAPVAWLLWCGILVFLFGAVTTVGLQKPRWQQFASGATALGAGITLAALQSPEAALACGVAGVAMARKSAVVSVWQPAEAIPRPNQWLAGLAAVVTLVVMLGLIRHALLVEAAHTGPSRWQTVFPTHAQTARHRAVADESDQEAHSHLGELWGLALVVAIAIFTRSAIPPKESTTLEPMPS